MGMAMLVTNLKNKLCPNCSEENVQTKLNFLKLSEDEYMAVCPEDTCVFHELRQGKPIVHPKFLESVNLPVKLLDHMDVHLEDIDNIVHFAAHDMIVKLSQMSDIEMQHFESFIQQITGSPCFEGNKDNFLTYSLMDLHVCVSKMKTIFDKRNADINPDYKKAVIDILTNIDNFTYPDDIFKPE